MKIHSAQFQPKATKTRVILCLVYAALMGRWYNRQIQDIQAVGNEWHNRALLVAVGTFFTILALIPLFPFKVFAYTFFIFVASGTPMIWGSARRKNRTLDAKEDWRSEHLHTVEELEQFWND